MCRFYWEVCRRMSQDEKEKFLKGIIDDDDDKSVIFGSNEGLHRENSSDTLASEKTEFVTLEDVVLLQRELGITKDELELLNYNQLRVIREAINREYDARIKEFNDDLKEDIESDLKKIQKKKMFQGRVVERENMTGNISMVIKEGDMLRGQKREALVELSAIWQEMQEERSIKNRKREKLLDEIDFVMDLSYDMDGQISDRHEDILKKAITGVSRTAKLHEIDEKLYNEFMDADLQREEDEYQDALDDDIEKDMKSDSYDELKKLSLQVDGEVEKLKDYQQRVNDRINEINTIKDAKIVKKLLSDLDDIDAFVTVYQRQKEEIDRIIVTYDECRRTKVLIADEDNIGESVKKALEDQTKEISELIGKTRSFIAIRALRMLKNLEEKSNVGVEKAETIENTIVRKDLIYILNFFGKALVKQRENSRALNSMTAEERFLVDKIGAEGKELDIKEYEDTTLTKELFGLGKWLVGVYLDGKDSEIEKQVRPYKIDNQNAVNILKNDINNASSREYTDEDYNKAVVGAINGIREILGKDIDVKKLTKQDLCVLAKICEDKFNDIQNSKEKEKKEKLLEYMKNMKEVDDLSEGVVKIYKDINRSIVYMFDQKDKARNIFDVLIACKEDASLEIKPENSLLIELKVVSDVKEYNMYENKYKKEYTLSNKDIDYVLDKISKTKVDGGYYYLALGEDASNMENIVGSPVISHKGIKVFWLDDLKLNLDTNKMEFSYNNIPIDKNKLYTVEQDKEYDSTSILVDEEKRLLDENTIINIYTHKGVPRFSSGIERKLGYAEDSLALLEYIHKREGNTEYEEEEKLIQEYKEKIPDLKNEIEKQKKTIEKLENIQVAYKKFKSVQALEQDQSSSEEIQNILQNEFKKLKKEVSNNSDIIKEKMEKLSAFQYEVDSKKLRIDIREDKKEEKKPEIKKEPKTFYDKIAQIFKGIVEGIKKVYKSVVSPFTERGAKNSINKVVNIALGIDDSKGNSEGLVQWSTEFFTMDNLDLKDVVMDIAKQRDIENNKKRIKNSLDEKEEKGVSLNNVEENRGSTKQNEINVHQLKKSSQEHLDIVQEIVDDANVGIDSGYYEEKVEKVKKESIDRGIGKKKYTESKIEGMSK